MVAGDESFIGSAYHWLTDKHWTVAKVSDPLEKM